MMLYTIIVIITVALDQLLKFWVVRHIPLNETVFRNNPIISLTHIQNDGAAWGMLSGKMWFFYIITLVVIVVLPVMIVKNLNESKWMTVGLSLILGGAIGNFIDRIRLNYVVDMFQFEFFQFPIFNLADAFLTTGVACVFIYLLFFEGKTVN
ncbi:signal peptidase II [Vagococcus acidifermentans]|uniref:Lipoprotein signal peptidase n=1 Tax=Vagococcus acidifermentans TaxID=564710 RepID=A0A430ALU2_9ENTE|nr:signal peptidase II [Vagococcus acidifermentans]RSU09091.1 signal peptidase II [Vagococcus acidifermentans]